MESTARHRVAEEMCFKSPQISHSTAVMVIVLAFHTEDPDGVGYAMNIFLFPAVVSEA